MFMVLESLIQTANNGEFSAITKRRVLDILSHLHPKSVLAHPVYLNRHGISYEDLPEVWDFILSKFARYGHEIDATFFYNLVLQFDKLVIADAAVEDQIWRQIRELFDKHEAQQFVDVQTAI